MVKGNQCWFSVDEDSEIVEIKLGPRRFPTVKELGLIRDYIGEVLKDPEYYKKESKRITDEADREIENILNRDDKGENGNLTNVYLVHDTDNNYLKIGRSKNPKGRVEILQVATAYNLELIGVIKDVHPDLESELHEYFKQLKVNGEWFEYHKQIINKFKEVINT